MPIQRQNIGEYWKDNPKSPINSLTEAYEAETEKIAEKRRKSEDREFELKNREQLYRLREEQEKRATEAHETNQDINALRARALTGEVEDSEQIRANRKAAEGPTAEILNGADINSVLPSLPVGVQNEVIKGVLTREQGEGELRQLEEAERQDAEKKAADPFVQELVDLQLAKSQATLKGTFNPNEYAAAGEDIIQRAKAAGISGETLANFGEAITSELDLDDEQVLLAKALERIPEASEYLSNYSSGAINSTSARSGIMATYPKLIAAGVPTSAALKWAENQLKIINDKEVADSKIAANKAAAAKSRGEANKDRALLVESPNGGYTLNTGKSAKRYVDGSVQNKNGESLPLTLALKGEMGKYNSARDAAVFYFDTLIHNEKIYNDYVALTHVSDVLYDMGLFHKGVPARNDPDFANFEQHVRNRLAGEPNEGAMLDAIFGEGSGFIHVNNEYGSATTKAMIKSLVDRASNSERNEYLGAKSLLGTGGLSSGGYTPSELKRIEEGSQARDIDTVAGQWFLSIAKDDLDRQNLSNFGILLKTAVTKSENRLELSENLMQERLGSVIDPRAKELVFDPLYKSGFFADGYTYEDFVSDYSKSHAKSVIGRITKSPVAKAALGADAQNQAPTGGLPNAEHSELGSNSRAAPKQKSVVFRDDGFTLPGAGSSGLVAPPTSDTWIRQDGGSRVLGGGGGYRGRTY